MVNRADYAPHTTANPPGFKKLHICVKKPWTRVCNNFSAFKLTSIKEVTKKVAHVKKNHKNAYKSCQIVLFSTKIAISNHFVFSKALVTEKKNLPIF
jgi:phosphorylcholine metabolism protein LicD